MDGIFIHHICLNTDVFQLSVTVFAHFYADRCLYMDCSAIILGYES